MAIKRSKKKAKTKTCANPDCTERFTYQRSTKKYCSAVCRTYVSQRQPFVEKTPRKQPEIYAKGKEGITLQPSEVLAPIARDFPKVRRGKNTAGVQLLNKLTRHVGCHPKDAYFQHTDGGGGVLTWNTVSGIRQQHFNKADLEPSPLLLKPTPKPPVAYAWDRFSGQPCYAA